MIKPTITWMLKNPLLSCGLGSFIAALLLLYQWPASDTTGYRELSASLLGSAGITLIIIALVETKHLSASLGATAKAIVNEGSKALDDKFDQSFDIINQCNRNGLIAIYAPRQSEEGKLQMHDAVVAEIRKTEQLSVMGISALDFFSYPRGAATQAGPYYESCRKRLADSSQAFQMEIRALLLAPDSSAARFRAEAEVVDGEQADIGNDTETATRGIARLNKSAPSRMVSYKFYDSHPQMWGVITDECVFVELYHSAPTVDLCKKLQEGEQYAADLKVNCTGGRVPVFQFQKQSNMYVALKEHFESMWRLLPEPPPSQPEEPSPTPTPTAR